jgi:hypothetical protein
MEHRRASETTRAYRVGSPGWDMVENADAITHGESELLHAESERARA